MSGEFYWPIMGPWEKFRGLHDDLEHCFGAATIGIGELSKIDNKVAAELGMSTDETEAGNRDRDYNDLILRMVLVYCVTLLETMVKDYARYLIIHQSLPGTTLPQERSMGGEAPPHWWFKSDALAALKMEEWKKNIANWCSAVINHDTANKPDKNRHKGIRRAIMNSATSFDHWRVLSVAVAIRNCIIHSGGLMNSVQFKNTPLCSVNEKPEWDIGLVYDLFSAMDMLNDRFSELTVEDS